MFPPLCSLHCEVASHDFWCDLVQINWTELKHRFAQLVTAESFQHSTPPCLFSVTHHRWGWYTQTGGPPRWLQPPAWVVHYRGSGGWSSGDNTQPEWPREEEEAQKVHGPSNAHGQLKGERKGERGWVRRDRRWGKKEKEWREDRSRWLKKGREMGETGEFLVCHASCWGDLWMDWGAGGAGSLMCGGLYRSSHPQTHIVSVSEGKVHRVRTYCTRISTANSLSLRLVAFMRVR